MYMLEFGIWARMSLSRLHSLIFRVKCRALMGVGNDELPVLGLEKIDT